MGGCLTIVGTPIGNLDDLSPRAAKALAEADLVLVEDSRHAQKLFRHLGLHPKVLAFHEHSEKGLVPRLVERIAAGERLALVSDAGMPLVSDPGFPLLAALRARRLPVHVVPGPNAALAALVISGLPTDHFSFEGFLPARSGPRRTRLEVLQDEERTLLFYEAPHRVLDTLADMIAVFGAERPAALCRELTKVHEECLRGSLGEIRAELVATPEKQRGEMTLVLAGAPPRPPQEGELEAVLRPLLAELPVAQAVRLAAAISGGPHKTLYALALKLREEGPTAP